MSYFSTAGYAPQKSSADVTEGLNSVGDALTDVLNRRQKAKQASDQLAFEQQDAQRKFDQNAGNLAYQNRIIDQRDKRDQLTFNQGQEAHKSDATIKAAKAMADGNPELAKAIMHGTVTYDPATGAETGRGEIVPGPIKDVGPEPQAPVAPEAPQGVPPEIAARRRGRTSTSVDENDIYKREGAPMPPQTSVDPTESFGRSKNFVPSGVTLTSDDKPEEGAPANFIPSGLTLTSDDRPVEPAQGGPTGNPPPTFRSYSPDIQASREQATKDMMAEEQAALDQKQYQGQRSAFESASAAYPGERARFEAERRQAEGERPYTARFGANDAGVTFTPETQRYAHRQAAADDFVASLTGAQLSPRDQQAADAAHRAILAGEDPQKVYKQFNDHMVLGEKFGDTTALQAQKDAAALERSKVSANSPKDQFFRERIEEGRAAGNRQDRGELRQELKDWETNTADIRKDAGVWKRLRMSLSNIKADNPVAQQDAILGLASVFRGGNAATKDVTTAVRGHLGGAEANAEGWMEQAATGKLGPEQQRTALGAVQNAVREHDEQLKEHYRSFVKRFGPGQGLEPQAATINGFMDSVLSEHGLSAPPVYDSADPGATSMGSTARPYQHKPKAAPPAPPRAPGAPPEIKARDKALKNKAVDDALGALGG